MMTRNSFEEDSYRMAATAACFRFGTWLKDGAGGSERRR